MKEIQVIVYLDEIIIKKFIYADEEQLKIDLKYGDLHKYTKYPYKIKIEK